MANVTGEEWRVLLLHSPVAAEAVACIEASCYLANSLRHEDVSQCKCFVLCRASRGAPRTR